MRVSHRPSRLAVTFDDDHAVAGAGLVLAASLTERLGVAKLIDDRLSIAGPAGAHASDKVLSLVHSALAGGDCIDDADALRAGSTGAVLGHRVAAPSTLGTFLRAHHWGHVRQHDAVSREVLTRAWRAGAGPAAGALTLDLDSTLCETFGLQKQGARQVTHLGCRGYHPLVAAVAGTGDVVHARLRRGRAKDSTGASSFVAETLSRVRAAGGERATVVRADSGFYARAVVDACQRGGARFSIGAHLHAGMRRAIEALPESSWSPIAYFLDGAGVAELPWTCLSAEVNGKRVEGIDVRLIVRRVPPSPALQQPLFATYGYHAFITDRDGDTLELEADHRRHAEIENTIKDLKHGMGLNHLPSGRFGANGAWLAINVLAHNLARWVSRLGLGETLITTKTLRRRHLTAPGRLTRSARQITLHLPRRWPWAPQFLKGITRLRAIPLLH